DVLKAVDEYIKKTNRKVMFEYVLIKNVNDSDDNARELAKIMDKKLYFVNLILYNPARIATPARQPDGSHGGGQSVAGGDTSIYKASDTKRVEVFRAILEKLKIRYTQRYRFGDDISAACGQFATNS
ncbi:MAG: hypothetical protein NT094_00495, partial [Candidatus Staskawiczbacteria bacterium]|nr:hypothetical protein [Candidatus Staskawiczbacteria bacterium]